LYIHTISNEYIHFRERGSTLELLEEIDWKLGKLRGQKVVTGSTIMMADNLLLNDNNNDGVGGGDDDVFVYTGGEQQVPRDVKRVRIAENVDTVPAWVFSFCRQLIEVQGHNRLRKIKESSFYYCNRLRRVTKMTGVVEIEKNAFSDCSALSELEFDKLEIIGYDAFHCCRSLRSINMPSVRRVGRYAFQCCKALKDVLFGPDLERIEEYAFTSCDSLKDVVLSKDLQRIEGCAFLDCTALTRIVIPLKDNLIIANTIFSYCENLSRVDILDGEIHETISSLHMEPWRNEMEQEIDRINQTLPNIRATEKTIAIQQWIRSAHSRMEHYKNEHQILLKEAMTLLELALWKANLHDDVCDDAAAAQEGVRVTRGQRKRARKDRCITSGASIVIKNVLPFLALK
jgi:hypothetical protein